MNLKKNKFKIFCKFHSFKVLPEELFHLTSTKTLGSTQDRYYLYLADNNIDLEALGDLPKITRPIKVT